MGVLSQGNFRAILDLLKQSYEIQTPEEFAKGLVAEIPKIISSDLVGWVETYPELNGAWRYYDNPPGFLTEKMHEEWKRLAPEDPRVRQAHRAGAFGIPLKISDFLSQTQFHRTALYNEMYRGMDVEDAMGFMFPTAPLSFAGVAVHRDRATFTEDDRLALTLLAPHIEQAWRNTKLVAEMRDQIRAFADTLEIRKEGIAVLGANRRVRFMTARALRYIEKYFGRLKADDGLPEKLDAWVRRQENPSQASRMAVPSRPLVLEADGGSELTVTLAPDGSGITLIMQERVVNTDLTVLGLTRRQSEVLLWVTRGKSNEDISSILNMSLGTVKKHLEHIFEKLGIESRTAAATMAMTALGNT